MADGAMDDATFAAYGVAQARLEHAGGYNWREAVNSTLHGLGFRDEHLDRSLETFSGGELTRASLARALAGDPDLLLLDEPTNHLDIASLEWLEGYLQQVDAAVVLVAHDRWFLEAVGTSVLELEAGRGEVLQGHLARVAGREGAARAGARPRDREADRRRSPSSSASSPASAPARARVRRRRARRSSTRSTSCRRDPKDGKGLGFAFKPPERSGRVVFEVEDGLLKIGDRTLLQDAELWLERAEHVSLVGANGSGKTTLISALTGAREFDGGKLRRGHNVKLGLLAQHTDDMFGTGSVVEACQRATKLTPNNARSLLGQFLFSGEEAEKPLDGLSGGERQRLSLAILVHSGANVLILDEPTNHLDVESREALEEALQSFQGALLLISHDRALLDAVGSRTVAIEDQTLHSYVGGWPEYVRVREERAEAAKTAKRSKPGGQAGRPAAAGRPEAALQERAGAREEARGRDRAGRGRPGRPRGRAGRPGCLERPARSGEVHRPPRGRQEDPRGALRPLGMPSRGRHSRQVVGVGDAGGQRRAVGVVEQADDGDRVVDLLHRAPGAQVRDGLGRLARGEREAFGEGDQGVVAR